MLTGAIHFFSHRPRSLKVDTPFVNAAAEGTEFLIRISGAEAHILMYEGIVLAQNEAGQLRLGPNDAALIRAGEKPIPEIVVRPRDAVAWAVHYPPVLAILTDGNATAGAVRHEVKNALEWIGDNNYRYALRSLDKIPENERDARNEALRAGILLNIGRVEEAEAAIERALAIDADAADAYALRTILHVTRNDRAQASRDADRAVKLAPNSSTALIAQSYARQASFDLEGARESLRAAVEKNPNDALAYARLSEIELSFGDIDRASDAAAKATLLAPNLARTQTVRGFAHLAEIDTGAARTAFTRAIELESTDPLPHLGQGLAKIRDGNLEAGRRDLEIAAGLDPNNALIRSYLGKAYFEEKRGPKDATQFEIAKKLDPNDPTPYLYDAIRKQTENRPVEALRDLERAIELNDNRAVYRSSLLLDEDRAARSARLAQIYSNLGFDQLALKEANSSLLQDPTNHSAHRFLSDAYSLRPRHELARASELVQAQLLQPININPLQPSSSTSNWSGGVNSDLSQATFNEFSPLFERNRIEASPSVLVGSNDTFGSDAAASVLWKNLSAAAGLSYFETDGFNQNSDIKREIANIFAQYAVTPRLTLQAEVFLRDEDRADFELEFEPSTTDRDRREIKQQTIRAGLGFSPSNSSKFIMSLAHLERDDDLIDDIGDLNVSQDGYRIEAQHIYNNSFSSLITGFGRYEIESDIFDGLFDETFNIESDHSTFYIYVYPKYGDFSLTIGASLDDFELGLVEYKALNPKFGLVWNPNDFLTFRIASFRVINQLLSAGTTIEPTQVAGFNQIYDEINGTQSDNIGFGFDVSLKNLLYSGFEILKRDISVPFGPNFSEQEDEINALYYLYLPIKSQISLTGEIKFDKWRRSKIFQDSRPIDIETLSIPIGIQYLSQQGISAGLTISHVNQKVDRVPGSTKSSGEENFLIVDADIAYRFPNRLGNISFGIENLFDKSFRYQTQNFRTVEIRDSEYVPERTFLARLTLKF